MIDTEDAVFREDTADRVIDGLGGFKIAADRLLDDDTRPFGDELIGAETLADRSEQIGRGRKIEHPDALFAGFECFAKAAPTFILGCIERDIAQPREEPRNNIGLALVFARMFLDRLAGKAAKFVIVKLAPRNRDD